MLEGVVLWFSGRRLSLSWSLTEVDRECLGRPPGSIGGGGGSWTTGTAEVRVYECLQSDPDRRVYLHRTSTPSRRTDGPGMRYFDFRNGFGEGSLVGVRVPCVLRILLKY